MHFCTRRSFLNILGIFIFESFGASSSPACCGLLEVIFIGHPVHHRGGPGNFAGQANHSLVTPRLHCGFVPEE